MTSDVAAAVAAELTRTARLMHVDATELAYLRRFDAPELRGLRCAVQNRFRAENAHRFKRLAAITAILPHRLVATLAQRSMSPRLAAGVVEALPADAAADVASRMAPEYLATTCAYLPPDVAGPIIGRLPDDVLMAANDVLIERRAYADLAEMVESLDDERLVMMMRHVGDSAALLEISAVVTADGQLDRVAALVPDELLSGILRYAVDSASHWQLALGLLARLPADQRRRLLSVAATDPEPSEPPE